MRAIVFPPCSFIGVAYAVAITEAIKRAGGSCQYNDIVEHVAKQWSVLRRSEGIPYHTKMRSAVDGALRGLGQAYRLFEQDSSTDGKFWRLCTSPVRSACGKNATLAATAPTAASASAPVSVNGAKIRAAASCVADDACDATSECGTAGVEEAGLGEDEDDDNEEVDDDDDNDNEDENDGDDRNSGDGSQAVSSTSAKDVVSGSGSGTNGDVPLANLRLTQLQGS